MNVLSERFRKSTLGILGKEMARKLGRPQRQRGASVGHEAMQEFGLGHKWSLQKEQCEHSYGSWEGLQEVPSVMCSI